MSNSIIHWELMVADPERAQAFYQRVFHWNFARVAPEYMLIDTGRERGGGLMQRPPGVTMSSLNCYFEVDDLQATLRAAVEAGATVIVPRIEVPDVGAFAMFLDPERIPIGIMQKQAVVHDRVAADPQC